MFSDLKTKAQAELDTLKAEVANGTKTAVDAIEAAFEAGATHHFLTTIETDASSVFEKLKAAVAWARSQV